jgi:3-oxoacyl-[acyl-carrier protein] reductase
MAVMIDLDGYRALVTGAGQGVGRAVALTLAQAGAFVAVNDIVSDRARSVVAEIEEGGGRGDVAAFDVTDWEAARVGIDRLGPIDVLVNNAGNAGAEGFTAMKPFADSDPGEWDRYIRINLYGVMNCARAVLPGMVTRQRGRIITIVSDAGRYGDANLAPYAAAKAGAAGFSRSIAREVGRYGITVNCVALATIHTPATERPSGDPAGSEDRIAKQLRKYIIRRRGEPDDVAGMVTYLASPMASWITGQTYPVNGGFTFAL